MTAAQRPTDHQHGLPDSVVHRDSDQHGTDVLAGVLTTDGQS